MKKLLLLIAAVAMMLPSCKEINEELDSLDNRLDKLENEAIPTIDEQIEAINTTISNLDAMDKELKGYIDNLTTTASNLQEQIDNTNSKIDEVKAELESEITVAKADVLAQLEALRVEIETELAQINATIATLQAKDTEIENKIATLNTYVDNELGKTTDWVNATFATLEQYNALVVEVAVIKEQINAANQSITALETYLTTKISADIAAAVYTLNADIQQKVTEITQSYTNAIKTAKDEITAAYTIAIQTAINTLDSSLKAWVGEQLANYYTITEIDAQLAALTQEMNGKLEAQKVYLEGLINELSASIVMSIAENKALIDGLQKDITNLQTTSAEHASRIAQNASTIAANTQNIIDISKSIYTNGSNIADNDKAIAENKALIEANAKLIADNAAEIEALKASPDVTVVKNAANIATNAENIATNAALIAANATAINNNAAAIANNAADILQLQQDLTTTKSEITEAYKTAINDAITTNNGVIDAKIAAKVEAINTRIDNEVAIINASIKSLTDRMNALETEMETLKGMVADFLKEFDEIKETIERILSMIQSVSYVPQYSDGKAVMPVETGAYDGEVELDFQLSPKSVVSDIVANWQDILSVKAVYTKTRAVTYVDMPILSCVADGQNGIITVVASGRNLGEEFYRGNQAINVALFISDGNNDKVSDFVEVIPVNAAGDEIIPANEIWYTSVDGKIVAPNIQTAFNSVLLSNTYHGDMGVLRFDADVTEIQDEAFKDCANIVSMTLPNTVEAIGESAFAGCSGLHTILLSENLKDLGVKAFKDCISLRSINIASKMVEIKESTFSNCNRMLFIAIPDNITSIGKYAFSNCRSLSRITIGNGLTSIDAQAFENCDSLSRVDISDLSAWCKISFYDVYSNPLSYAQKLYINNELAISITIPSDINVLNNYTFNHLTSLQELYIGDNVSDCGWRVFYGCSGKITINSDALMNNKSILEGTEFSDVTIGDKVLHIGDGFFDGYIPLVNVTISDNVESIGEYAFRNCNNIQSIIFPHKASEIKKYTFYGCESLTDIKLHDDITKIGESAFASCSSLKNVSIGNNVSVIGDSAFSDCSSLASITIPNNVTSIGQNAFSKCVSVNDVYIGSGVSHIWAGTFTGCKGNLTINSDLNYNTSSSDSGAFYRNQWSNVVIGEGVTLIGPYAFYECESLSSITIPQSVQSIGKEAFKDCKNLNIVNISDIESWCEVNIADSSTASPFYYGAKLYHNNLEVSILEIPSTITSIKRYAFYGCESITSVIIPDSVTFIGDSAFAGCASLVDVTIGKGVSSINKAAFNCSSLTTIYCKPTTPPAIYYYNGSVSCSFPSNSNLKIYVPQDSYSAYRQSGSELSGQVSTRNWYKYRSYLESYDFE